MVTNWDLKHPEKIREYKREWNKRNKENHAKANKDYAERHPDRIKARNMANNNLKHLKRKGYEFHHPDYSKPLLIEIVPIKEHQMNIHGGIIKL